jgi:hypothetical protein
MYEVTRIGEGVVQSEGVEEYAHQFLGKAAYQLCNSFAVNMGYFSVLLEAIRPPTALRERTFLLYYYPIYGDQCRDGSQFQG